MIKWSTIRESQLLYLFNNAASSCWSKHLKSNRYFSGIRADESLRLKVQLKHLKHAKQLSKVISSVAKMLRFWCAVKCVLLFGEIERVLMALCYSVIEQLKCRVPTKSKLSLIKTFIAFARCCLRLIRFYCSLQFTVFSIQRISSSFSSNIDISL